ncbi:MAG TPA: hypothetical protein VK907_09465, partial [Phnomibacter sp.]|nr:hypothetical protein [Phnomibacter sp.]
MLFASCSVNKYLQPGEAFYDGAKIIIDDSIKVDKPRALRSELNDLLRPKPNKKILGRRQKVWYYFIAGDVTKDKGLRYWLKSKLGEPPVLMNDVDPERNVSILKNHLENIGYFFAQGKSDTVWRKHSGSATYTVTPGHRYHYRNVTFPADSGSVATIVRQTAPESFLKAGNPYVFETLKNERIRIDDYMKQRGYYLFNPDYLLMRVDTTVGDHQADIFVTIKRETPEQALLPWSINNVYVYPNYEPSSDSIVVDSSYWFGNYFVIDPAKAYKPKVFEKVIGFKPNIIYNKDEHNKTLNRLVNIGTFRFVRNRFEELPDPSDTGRLNAYYYLVASKRRNLRFETSGKTSSANLAGVEVNLNWRNRNLFRGAEQLMLKAFGGFDIQFAGQNKGYNIYHFGVEGSISWPRMVPFNFASTGAFIPFTRLSISDEWQQRQRLYTVNTLKATYSWAWRPDIRREHLLSPMQITYVNNRNVSQEYIDQIARDSALARVIE